MSSLHPPPPDPPSDPQPCVRPLTQSDVRGRCYRRRADVEEQIAAVLRTDPSTWTADGLHSETVVYLIRELCTRGDRDRIGRLVGQLGRRINRIALDSAQGFDPVTTEEIVLEVGTAVIELILAEEANRQSEFLEVAFRQAVTRRTINKVESRSSHPRPHQFAPPGGGGSDGTAADASATIEDRSPRPEEFVIGHEERALFESALGAITDARHREAIVLLRLGWPISDKDPSKPSLCTQFGRTPRQIHNWIQGAIDQMRDALGEKS